MTATMTQQVCYIYECVIFDHDPQERINDAKIRQYHKGFNSIS